LSGFCRLLTSRPGDSYEKDGETIYTDLVATTFNAFQVANANTSD
jgi:hypothetical protein